MALKRKFLPWSTCVGLSDENVEQLDAMKEKAFDVTYKTFCKYVDFAGVPAQMGYATGRQKGLRIEQDFAVRFRKSFWNGEPCFFMVHSSIEHIYLLPG